MTTALRDHGPIIRITRNGNVGRGCAPSSPPPPTSSVLMFERQREYLVAKEYTRTVLTDEKSFSFERGNAQVRSPSTGLL